MKRALFLGLLFCGFVVGAKAQAVDTDICSIAKNPASFNGKMVRVKGIAVAGYDQFIIKDPTVCGYQVDGIWLEYPTGTKGKAGAATIVTAQPARNYAGPYKAPTRTPVVLDKSKDFKQFDSLMSQQRHGMGMCLGCVKNTVSATFVGRLDSVANTTLKRDKDGKVTDFGGFGNMNMYPARLVLQSVSDITPHEVSYAALDDIFKGQRGGYGGPPSGGMFDPVAAAKDLANAMTGIPAGDTIKKDVALFPKSGDHNGVVVSYGSTNELPKDEVSSKDSPDGVQYNCIINLDRFNNDNEGQKLTIIHAGHHIADLKATGDVPPPFVAEYNAWTMTVVGVAIDNQKTLALPGGELLWNAAWEQGSRNDNIDKALRDFLSKTAALSQ